MLFKNKLKLQGLIYPIGYMMSSGANFLITIVLTHYFTKSDFGSFSIYKASIFTLWPFIGLSTHFYLQSHYYKDSSVEFHDRLISSIFLNFGLFTFTELLCILFSKSISNFLDIDLFWILTIPIAAFLLCIVRITLVVNQLQKRPFQFFSIALSQVLITVTLILVLVIFYNHNWTGRAVSFLFGIVVACAIGLYSIRRKRTQIKSKKITYLKDAFIFGTSAILVDICIVCIGYSDKIFIKKIVNTESLGGYSVALQLAAIIAVVDSAFIQAFYPRLYKLYAKEDSNRIIKESFKYLLLIIGFAILYISTAPIVYNLFLNENYLDSFHTMNLIIVSMIALSIYKILVSKLYYFKIMEKLILPSILIVVFNIGLHYFLVPRFGVAGAIYTNIFSYSLLAISVAFVSFRLRNNKL